MTRAFVIGTGRCGTMTWYRACTHLTSHTAGHESRASKVAGRLDYSDNFVAVDNRLAWFTGLLDERYGDSAVYCHLTRDPELVARSYAKRFGVRAGIAPAFASGVIRRVRLPQTERERVAACRAMVAAVTANIELFLKDKSKVVRVDISDPTGGFDRMCDLLGAEGDMDAAHEELRRVTNASKG